MVDKKDSCHSVPLALLVAFGLLLTGLSCLLPAQSEAGAPKDRAAYAPWYDYSWMYRKPLILDNSQNGKALKDYPIFLNLSVADLMAAGKLRADWGDMRFTDSDGTTLLSYWEETAGNVWLRVPSIPASAKKTVYFYYGNPSAVLNSSGPKTFDFFDEFDGNAIDSSKWQLINDGPSTVSNGQLTISADGKLKAGKVMATNAPTDDYYVLRARLKITAGIHVDERIGLSIKTDTSTGQGYCYVLRDFTNLDEKSFLDDYVVWNSRAGKWAKDTWYVEEIYHDGSNVKGRLDDGAWQSQAWSGRTGCPALYFGSYDGKSAWDWALVRPFNPPDPKYSLGTEEVPFSFESVSFDPKSPNEGDTVRVNATFRNPTTVPIQLDLSFREGEEYAESTLIEPRRQVTLTPSRESTFQLVWNAKGGDHTIWVAVDDGPVASVNFTVNWLPVLDYISDQSLMQGWFFRLQLKAQDRGGDPLKWAEDCPLFDFNKTNNTGAEIAFLPANDDVGVYFANISVTDPKGCCARQTVKFTISNLNDPPVLDRIPDMSAFEDVLFRYQANASDPDMRWGDTIRFSDDSYLFDIDNQTGEFSFTPGNEQVGRFLIEIAVKDKEGASASRGFNLTVRNENDPPAINPAPAQFTVEHRLWQLRFTASDPDQDNSEGDTLRFSDDSPLFDIGPESGLVSYLPTNDDVGVHRWNITVTDRGGASASTPLVLTVGNVNDPPSISPVPDQTALEDQLFELQFNATDPDLRWGLDNLTFSDDSGLFDIDPRTGAFSFSPTNDQVGKYLVKIKVTDESGETASISFNITVQNVNDPPFEVGISSPSEGAVFREGEQIWLNATGRDIDKGDVLTFRWLENEREIASGRSARVALEPGDHLITLEVTDGTETVSAELTVSVKRTVREHVTVQDNSWIPLAVVAVVAAAAAAGGFLVFRRRRRKEEEAPEAVAAAEEAPPREPESGPKVRLPPPVAGLSDDQKKVRKQAQKAIDSTEDRVADFLEGTPPPGVDITLAMESLELARDFMKEGDYPEALVYAKEAETAVTPAPRAAEAPGEPEEPEKPDVGKLACPGCGEKLDPDWPICPICGHQTR